MAHWLVKSIHCSSREPRLSSQHALGSSQRPVIQDAEVATLFWTPQEPALTCTHPLFNGYSWLSTWLYLDKLPSGNGEHTCDLTLRLEDTGFWPRSWGGMTYAFNPDPEVGRFTFNGGHTFLDVDIKATEEERFSLGPACPRLASTSIPSLALESTSLGFQHILQTSWDAQPCGAEQH